MTSEYMSTKPASACGSEVRGGRRRWGRAKRTVLRCLERRWPCMEMGYTGLCGVLVCGDASDVKDVLRSPYQHPPDCSCIQRGARQLVVP